MVARPGSRPRTPVPARPVLDGVAIEPLRRRHLRSVLAIEAAVYPRPWSPALFASEMEQTDTRRYFVALAPRPTGRLRRGGRQVVGYAGVLVQAVEAGPDPAREAHITTVAVHPEHHRRKVASRLLLALLDAARELGADAATLEVRVANRGAQRLYSAFGFSPVGVRPGYYAETGEDAVIMWLYGVQGADFAARLERQAARLSEPGGASGAPDLHVPWVKGRVGLPDARAHDGDPRRR